MPRIPSIAGLLAACCTATCAFAQDSVLQLQTSYHIGLYAGVISSPSGALKLRAGSGQLDLQPNGSVTGMLDLIEADTTGVTSLPASPLVATYVVQPNGEAVLDLDPSNPGVELLGAWTNADGSVLHSTRQEADPDALMLFGVAASTGHSNASLVGDYHFVAQRLEFVGGTWATVSEQGTATFDGLGGGTVTGTSQNATTAGTTTGVVSGAFTYAVASDGAMTLNGSPGGLSADGELLFVVTAEASGEIGMVLAVRAGTSYDFNDLAARYSLTGQGYELGLATNLPRSTTQYGELMLSSTSSTSGAWSVSGVAVDATAFGQTQGALTGSGGATLTTDGAMTLNSPMGAIEFAFAAGGDFAVGRVVQPDTNLLFAMRQCGVSGPFGSGTAGTGGVEPKIGMRTFPTIGNPGWNLRITEGIGGGIALMAVSFGSLPGIPALGGLIWIDPTGAYTPLLLLSGTTGAAGAGSGETPVTLPNVLPLVGVPLFAQALVLDPAAPAGFAMTSGFQATICR